MERSRGLAERLLSQPGALPVTFKLGGIEISGIPEPWHPTATRRLLDACMVETVFEGRDPGSGLQLRVECVAYKDYPVVEWVAWLTNVGTQPTPLISDILAFDADLPGASPSLDYVKGDQYCEDGYEPFNAEIKPGDERRFSPAGGRPSRGAFPYYRLLFEDGGHTLAVGWSGQWETAFTGVAQGVHVAVGQERTHLRLMPGETIRTPRITVLSWTGNRTRAVNLWRRWYGAHILPRPDGNPLGPCCAGVGTDEGEEFTAATEKNQLAFIEKYRHLGLFFNVWWIDAGWYPCYDAKGERKWWETGTWKPDPERFPNGMKAIADRLRDAGAKLLVWFEPERVRPGTQLDKERPEWLLRSDDPDSNLLNLGRPACREWLTEHVCDLIRDNGIGIYRQDHNFDPLARWRAADADDRQGVTENLYVQGYLRFWDDLLAQNPGLWIDSCASGGGRNDLETMRRSVPLHYSDYGYGIHAVKLAFHRTLFEWLPYFKETTLSWDIEGDNRYDGALDSFAFHCGMAPMLFPSIDIHRDDYDYEIMRRMTEVWRKVASPILHGDYYPLTPYHRSTGRWVAWQFDEPETGRGFVQGIRLQDCPDETLIVQIEAVDPDATYEFENPETGEALRADGKQLVRDGFTFKLPRRSGAIWLYKKED